MRPRKPKSNTQRRGGRFTRTKSTQDLTPYERYPAAGVPQEEPGVTLLTEYDKKRMAGRRKAIRSEYPGAFGSQKKGGRFTGQMSRRQEPPTSKELENRVRAYAPQPILAYADPENVAKERRKKLARSRGYGRNTVLGNGTETLG